MNGQGKCIYSTDQDLNNDQACADRIMDSSVMCICREHPNPEQICLYKDVIRITMIGVYFTVKIFFYNLYHLIVLTLTSSLLENINIQANTTQQTSAEAFVDTGGCF